MQRLVRIPIDGIWVNALALLITGEVRVHIDLVSRQRLLALLVRLAQQIGFQDSWRNEPILVEIDLLDGRIDERRRPVWLADNARMPGNNLIVVDRLDLH